jgi:DNA polymerase
VSPALDELRQYVHDLQERDGVRRIRLTRAAQVGLERLAAAVRAERASPPIPARATVVASAREIRPVAVSEPAKARNIVAWAPAAAAVVQGLPLDAPAGASKAEQLQHLAARASVCVKCAHLAARRHSVVFGTGNPEARLMFVGEAPGEDEDLQGEPFVGRAGQLLTKMIAAMGLNRADVYIANIVKCRPDMPPGAPGNRKPTRQEMETCVPFLRAQIDVIKPAALVALGATAVEGLLGSTGTIGSLRGKFLEYRGAALMPTYHPAYLLRNQGSNTEKRKVWEDLLKVMERLEMPISEKQRGFFLKS